MNSTPQLSGYQLDQRLLVHPLAELWRGRSFTGMEIVALILSEAGAADQEVRDRLAEAGRGAALDPQQQETPLWAANFTTARPYAITQLVPGQSGAERLVDPLDGMLGNDEESLIAVRSQLAQYGAARVPPEDLHWAQPNSSTSSTAAPETSSTAAPETSSTAALEASGASEAGQPVGGKLGIAEEYRRRLGMWAYVVVVIAVLIIFSVTYSVGGAVRSAVKDAKPAVTQGPAPAPVSPGPLPSPVILPGIAKAKTTPYQKTAGQISLVGATYQRGADVRVVDDIGLPFAIGWPRPASMGDLGESSSVIYRRVFTGENPATASLDARIAVHPCRALAGCLADRAAFDRQWTAVFRAPVPVAAKDGQTWITVHPKPYAVSMTHAFTTGGRWWLVGTIVIGEPGEEQAVQRVLNDIRSQTP